MLNTSRLSKSGWAKIAHHLGRSGSSGVSGIKLKYRTLKEQAHKSAGNTGNAAPNGRDSSQIVCLPAYVLWTACDALRWHMLHAFDSWFLCKLGSGHNS